MESIEQAKGAEQPHRLKWWELFLLRALAAFMGLWLRTLRFSMDAETRDLLNKDLPPMVGVGWHNRLFVVPEFYRRFFKGRRVKTMVSSSKDGAYMTEFFRCFGIGTIRGSQRRRGVQALKELIQASRDGWDIAITPDGSRGPIYVMKPGAIAIALKTGAPMLLVSFNFGAAHRFKSWDRFYLPLPFSQIEIKLDWEAEPQSLGEDAKAVTEVLQGRLDVITDDLNV
jgi:lysophospholipid acyltransferase (LPLAT)-like uncharacterized protein